MGLSWRKPAGYVVYHPPMRSEGEALQAVSNMGVGPLVWDWLSDALFGLGEAVSSGHSQHQVGTVWSVDHELRAAIDLTQQHSFDRTNPRVKIVCRSWERGDAHTFHRFDVALFCDRGLGFARWVTDSSDAEPEVFFTQKFGFEGLLHVQLKPCVLGSYFFMNHKSAKVVDLCDKGPWVAAEVLADEDWKSWD